MPERARPDQSIFQSPIASVRTQNRVLEAAEVYQQQRLGRATPQPWSKPRESGKLMVKNTTESALPAGSVLQLGAYLLNEACRYMDSNIWLAGAKPADPGAAERYCITATPLVANQIGAAFVSGCCVARINVNSTDHKYATPVDDSTDLESAESGPIEILSPLENTGSQHVYARLGSAPPLHASAQVYHAVSAGACVQANSEGYHPGRLRDWSGGTATDGEDVWIKIIDGDGEQTTRDETNFLSARYAGTIDGDGEGDIRPLYVATQGEIEFKAVADDDITADSSETASIWTGGSDSGVDVTVYLNWMHGSEDVSADKQLVIRWFPDEQKWIVLSSECEE